MIAGVILLALVFGLIGSFIERNIEFKRIKKWRKRGENDS